LDVRSERKIEKREKMGPKSNGIKKEELICISTPQAGLSPRRFLQEIRTTLHGHLHGVEPGESTVRVGWRFVLTILWSLGGGGGGRGWQFGRSAARSGGSMPRKVLSAMVVELCRAAAIVLLGVRLSLGL
jgi:hypothetical protein